MTLGITRKGSSTVAEDLNYKGKVRLFFSRGMPIGGNIPCFLLNLGLLCYFAVR